MLPFIIHNASLDLNLVLSCTQMKTENTDTYVNHQFHPLYHQLQN
jgi:hypothetical protein